jgi:phosphoribosylformylglycinamidine synthase
VVLLRGSEPGDETDAQAEFGSSEYAQEILGELWGFPPALELEKEAALQKCLVEAIQAGLIESAHDVSEGGLAVTVAECGFRNQVGARLELNAEGLPTECLLFGEDASRVVVSCDPEQVQGIQQVAEKYGVAAELIGATIADNLEIRVEGKVVVSAPVGELREAWGTALERALHTETEERLVPAVIQKS